MAQQGARQAAISGGGDHGHGAPVKHPSEVRREIVYTPDGVSDAEEHAGVRILFRHSEAVEAGDRRDDHDVTALEEALQVGRRERRPR